MTALVLLASKKTEGGFIHTNFARRTGRTDLPMPADFGDITAYHREEAARHYALAQAARERESHGEAEYHTTMAIRWYETAREQKTAMREPVRHIAHQKSNYRPSEPLIEPRAPFAGFLAAVSRMVQAIGQALPRRTAPIEGLSLR